MPTHLTAIFKSCIAPEEGAALQGKKGGETEEEE